MKILITNTVTLNGGDFAILDSIVKLFRNSFGENIEFIVYDSHASIAAKYYPEIKFRQSLHQKYIENKLQHFRNRFRGSSNRFVDSYNRRTLTKLMYAAKLFSSGTGSLASLLLSKEQLVDFHNYTSADLIISTGGTYLVENYSIESRIFDYQFTLAMKKPLIFFTQSLRPFLLPYNQFKLKDIFNKSKLILLRDNTSLENLKKIGVNVSHAEVCADVVFSDAEPAVLEEAKNRNLQEPLKIGISVRDWKYFNFRSNEVGMLNYRKSVAAICEFIVNTLGGEIVFISTCQGITEYHTDDSQTAKSIYDMLSDEVKGRILIDSDFHTPEGLKTQIEQFDIVISTRMHVAIQALTVGVPVLPIAYEFKTKELFIKLIDSKFILDIDNIEEEQALDIFKQFYTELPHFRHSLFGKVIEEYESALTPVKYLLHEQLIP